jgi:hypothetical protein
MSFAIKNLEDVTDDQNAYKLINKQMIDFLETLNGGKGWVELFELSKLRAQQIKQKT